MSFIVKPSRNPIVQAALKGLRAEQRAEKKPEAEATLAPKKPKPQRAAKKGKR
jgi:hypothetical protein